MKTPKLLKAHIPILLAASLLGTPFAYAGMFEKPASGQEEFNGGDHGGGGNTINYKLIESHAKKIQEIKGAKEFRSALIEFHKLAPDLAENIVKKMDQATFYIVPREIKELPGEKTGLHFKTEQCAYQEGREIFIEENCLKAKTPAEAAELLMHEGLMMTQEKKKEATVRQVMVRITAKPYDQVELQNALALNKFGTYLTEEQKKLVGQEARAMYLDHMKNVAKIVNDDCAKPGIGLNGLRNTLSSGWRDQKPNDDELIEQMFHQTSVTVPDGFVSPFHRIGFHGGLGTFTTSGFNYGSTALNSACDHNPKKMPKEVCAEAEKYRQDYSYRQVPAIDGEKENRQMPLQNLLTHFHNGAGDGIKNTLNDLVENPNFMNVMAVSLDSKRVSEAASGRLDFYNDRVLGILRKVEARQASIRHASPAAQRNILCSGMSALGKELNEASALKQKPSFTSGSEISPPAAGETWADPAL